MSIATEIERLQTAKADIKAAIEEKGVTVGDGTIDTYAEKIGEISGGGGEDFLKYCSEVCFEDFNLFGKEEVVLNLDNLTTMNRFNYTDHIEPKPPENTTVKHLTINCPNKIDGMQLAFARMYVPDNTLEHLTLNVNTSEVTTWYYTFFELKVLKVIDGQPLNFTKTTNTDGFKGLELLEEVRFVENSFHKTISFALCPKISNDTIQSIIDGLADLTGGTAQTLTLHATVGAKLTDEQKASITAKNWTLVY